MRWLVFTPTVKYITCILQTAVFNKKNSIKNRFFFFLVSKTVCGSQLKFLGNTIAFDHRGCQNQDKMNILLDFFKIKMLTW